MKGEKNHFHASLLLKSLFYIGNNNYICFYPEYIPFWFLRELIILLLFTPIIYTIFTRLHKSIGLMIISVLSICSILGYWPLADPCYPGLSIHAYLFFILGSYLSLRNINIFGYVCKLSDYKLLLILGVFLSLSSLDAYFLTYSNESSPLHELVIILGVFLTIVMSNILTKSRSFFK